MKRIAVIGAGMAGLTCARALQFAGHEVVVFEKARGPGGRLATRRSEQNFDHGAQFFTTRDPAFAAEVRVWREIGVVEPWTPRIANFSDRTQPDERDRFVGAPRMSALTRHVSSSVTTQFETRVQQLVRTQGWELADTQENSLGTFDSVVLAIPAPQAVDLLRSAAPELAGRIADDVTMLPCWAVMATFEDALDVDFDAAWCSSPLDWIALNASKPGRGPGHSWVLHADASWSIDHLEDEPAAVAEALLGALSSIVGRLPRRTLVAAHRWRYARVSAPFGTPAHWDAELGIGLCGDWLIGPRVEAAWLSGRALAAMI